MAVAPDEIYTEVGRLTMATSAADNQLTILLARLMSHRQDQLDIGFPSIFVFSVRSIDQRFDLVRKAFLERCGAMLCQPRHENIRRAAEFAENAMNKAFSNIRNHRWIRNDAAHGNIVQDGDETYILPAMLNIEGHAKIATRGDEYKQGIKLSHLQAATADARADIMALGKLGHVFWSLLEWKDDPTEFLARADDLAHALDMKKVQLKDPREGRPMRQRKEKRGRAKS